MTRSTNFRDLPFIKEMTPLGLKQFKTVLSAFKSRPIPVPGYAAEIPYEHVYLCCVLTFDPAKHAIPK